MENTTPVFLNQFNPIDKQAKIETLENEIEHLQRLLDVSHSLMLADSFEPLQYALIKVIEHARAKRGFIMLLDEQDQWRIVASVHISAEVSLKICNTLVEDVLNSDRSIVIEHVPDSPTYKESDSAFDLNLMAIAGLPLRFKDRLFGLLYVDCNHCSHRFSDQDEDILQSFADQAVRDIATARKIQKLRRQTGFRHRFGGIVGESEPMQKLFGEMDQAVSHNLPLLILGETGAGKGLVAETIHNYGLRRSKPIIHVNCGGLTESLGGNELFGHCLGAYTGADTNQAGYFEQADGGTLFLDEIGDLPLSLQANLLQVLDSGLMRRIGEVDSIRQVDVRLIAVTNRDLPGAIVEGKFRDDLFHRLEGHLIHVPPLRDRPADIPLLVYHFIQTGNIKMMRNIRAIAPDLMAKLSEQKWPGNVRQLRNTVYNLISRAETDELRLNDLPPRINGAGPKPDQPVGLMDGPLRSLVEVEKEYILQAIARCKGNKAEAARRLGLKKTTLQSKMRKLGLN